MFCPTAEKLVVPATVNVVTPDWATAVVDVTARLPLTDPVPITSEDTVLFRVTFAPARLTAPVNRLALSKVIFCPGALTEVVPPITKAPLSVTAPPEIAVKFPVSVIACKSSAVVSRTLTFANVPLKAAKLTVLEKVLA